MNKKKIASVFYNLFFLAALLLFTLAVVEKIANWTGYTLIGQIYPPGRLMEFAAMMLLFVLALTGIPPTGGFVGKIYLFAAAVEAGWIWVAVIGVLTSAVSLYYYMGLVVQMYLKDSEDQTPRALYAPGLIGTIALCAVVTLVLGLAPGPFIEIAKASLLPLP